MNDLKRRLHALDLAEVPDIWADASARTVPRRAELDDHDPDHRLSRIATVVVALALSLATIGLLVVAFTPDPHPGPHSSAPPQSGQARGPFQVLQHNERARTLDATGSVDDLGKVDAQDIDTNGRIVALRPDQLPYFYREDAVVVIDAVTGTSNVIALAAPNETFNGPARWSPDGRTIALRVITYPAPLADVHPGPNSGDRAVCLIRVDDGTRRCFPQAGSTVSLDWSPDGRRLLVAGLGGPVSILDDSTGKLTKIIDASGGADADALLRASDLGHVIALTQAAWSFTGRYVAVHAAVSGGSVMIIYSVQGDALAIGAASDDAEPFAWSPSEDVLAYAVAHASPAYRGPTEVRFWSPSSGDVNVIDASQSGASGIASMTWSPDGRSLALNAYQGTWLLERVDEGWSLRRLDLPGSVIAWG
jgi:dipeptidyl aminopeptidase/acylaminoacyl peptidase